MICRHRPNPENFIRNSDGMPVKLMVGTDGYWMARIPGCMPFVLSLKELAHDYHPQRGRPARRGRR